MPVATAVALRGQRIAEARAADQAADMVLTGPAASLDIARSLIAAQEASPDMLDQITRLHQAGAYDATRLRGASAAAAALVRWSV
jgi:ABC-type Fe3+ transport system substrate-binding protein